MNKKNRESAFQQVTFDIYIGKLPKNTTEDELEQLFTKYGALAGILCRYNKGEYGYAIVKFINKRDAEKVLQDAGKLCIKGSYIDVKCAQRKDYGAEDFSGRNSVNPGLLLDHQRNTFPIGKFHPAESHRFSKGNEYLPIVNSGAKQNKPVFPVMMEVLCTSIENAITFYGCPVYRCEDLQKLSAQLNVICANQPRLCRKPAVKRVYAALFREDLCWYRCLILQNSVTSKPGMCSVFYIDYGNQEDVSSQNIVELPDGIRMIPPFSTKFVFSNLVCSSKLQSNVSYLHHLVNKRMSLCVSPALGLCEYFVSKCSCNGIDVISEIVNKGFASYKNKKISSLNPPSSSSKSEKIKEKSNENLKKNSANVANGVPCNGTEVKHMEYDIKHIDNNEDVNGSKCKSPKFKIPNPGSVLRIENHSDLVPKKIMKRRSQSEVAESVSIENRKASNHCFIKMDSIISNLKLVNNIRDLISLSDDDIIIKNAVDLLMNEMCLPTEEISDHIKESDKTYRELLNQIRYCSDKSLLPELKLKRDQCRNKLCEEFREYLKKFDTSVIARKNQIQRMITDLESNSNAWMNVYLDNYPSTVEELLLEYKKAKDAKNNVIQNARRKTNEKHKTFIEFLGIFQKEFSLNVVENSGQALNTVTSVSAISKEALWSVKFETSLCELGKALEEEIEAAVSKGNPGNTVIQCLLDKLDVPKEKLDAECANFEFYSSMYKDLCSLKSLEPTFSELTVVQENIKNLTKKHTHQNPNEFQVSNVIFQLHRELLKEDNLMEVLAKAFELHFPELNIEYPELKLLEYHKYKYLLKHNWKNEYFPFQAECARMEFSYFSQYLNEPSVIKEFTFENEDEKNSVLTKVVQWNEVKSDYLAKVQAVFHKDQATLCALLPQQWKTLFEAPCMPRLNDSKKTCEILQYVLKGLKDIHSRGLVHGSLHPSSILYDDGKILLDFCCGSKVLNGKALIKGINFQPPKCEPRSESADMYSFGCLVLWALFPNLLFTSTSEGVPNLVAFKSIVEEVLSAKDYASLAALVNTISEVRPTSSMLLSSGFLKDFKCFPKLSCNNTIV